MAMTILYPVGEHLYVNLTNKCPCACTFCIRQNGDGAYGSDSLWLQHDPSLAEVKKAFEAWNLADFTELVFCGYGEPTEALEILLLTAQYAKTLPGCPPVRLNTNGLSDLIHGKKTAHLLEGLIDTVSISLNASNKERYLELTRAKYGIGSFDAMLKFAVDCKEYVPNVVMTVVEKVENQQEIDLCQKICDDRGLKLRVRIYEDS